ncbi:MAG: hypothetical protein SV422_07130, partial [Pseudomonadota bacterium]|nr:hypothetical protein [Pseudomonadota bacterium]
MKVVSGLMRSYLLPLLLFGMSPAFAQTPGTEDTSFNIASLSQSFPALGVQPDGSILVATGIPTGGGLTLRRYQPNGAPDSSFTVSGPLADRVGVPYRILVDPLARIYVAGTYHTQYASPDSVRNETGTVIVRFLANGTFDTNFGEGGYLRHSYYVETNPSSPSSPPVVREEGVSGTTGVADFGLLPDGKLLVVGGSRNNPNSLLVARYDVDGRLDTSFGANGSREVGLGEALEQFVLQI